MRRLTTWGIVALFALGAGEVHAGPTPEAACAIAKNKAAVKKVAARAKCWQKAAASGAEAPDAECLSAAEMKFVAAIAKAEAKDGCLSTGDAGAVGGAADACLAGIVAETPPTTTTTSTTVTTTSTTDTTTTTELGTLWYQDLDGDSSGNPAVSMYSVSAPSGYVPSWLPVDCDDNDPLRYPGKSEGCDLVADSDCNAATPDCPAGCYADRRPGGHLYMFCSTLRDYFDADSTCNGFTTPYTLVKIDDSAEDDFVWTYATYHFGLGSYYWWIGGHDTGAGGWKWEDGTPMTYTHWGSGEPSISGNRAQMFSSFPLWRSAFFSEQARYVCEQP